MNLTRKDVRNETCELKYTTNGNHSRMMQANHMAHVAQLVEHVLGKDEVTRSIRVVGSMRKSSRTRLSRMRRLLESS